MNFNFIIIGKLLNLLSYPKLVFPVLQDGLISFFCIRFAQRFSWGRFLKNCAQLLRPEPNRLTAFSGEEVERQKMFLTFNFFTRKSSQKVGRQVQYLSAIFKKLTPGFCQNIEKFSLPFRPELK